VWRPEPAGCLGYEKQRAAAKRLAAIVSNCTQPSHPWKASLPGKEPLGRKGLERVWLYRLPNHAAINLRAITVALHATDENSTPILQTSLPTGPPYGSSGTQLYNPPSANDDVADSPFLRTCIFSFRDRTSAAAYRRRTGGSAPIVLLNRTGVPGRLGLERGHLEQTFGVTVRT
jgi:hypothetical protein